ncbi:hypothetical protein BFP70_16615 [Thioclava sp. SK-1]|nr:hypothetical protein BFP70_16615 [Thioclava sp. SK-1]
MDWLAASVTNDTLSIWDDGAEPARHIPLQGADAHDVIRAQMERHGLTRAVLAGPESPHKAIPCAPVTPSQALGVIHIPILTQTAPAAELPARQTATVAGVLQAHPKFDGVICLTGPETYWVHVSAAEVISVAASSADRLFRALYPHRLPTTDAAFNDALSAAQSRPERMLLTTSTQDPNRFMGSLIGAELTATRAWWLGQQVLALGPTAHLRAHALTAQATMVTTGADEPALLAGLRMAAGL